MDKVIVLCAQLLPLLPPAAAVLLWLRRPRDGKFGKFDLGLRALLAVALTAALMLAAGLVHQDLRPFVVDPSHPALFSHSADNGFPSDHTAYAATVALLIAGFRRRLGLALLVAAVIGGLARVAANVHHLQDVAAGVVIAIVAVTVTTAVFTLVQRQHQARLETRSGADTPATP